VVNPANAGMDGRSEFELGRRENVPRESYPLPPIHPDFGPPWYLDGTVSHVEQRIEQEIPAVVSIWEGGASPPLQQRPVLQFRIAVLVVIISFHFAQHG
jgi:hypothetical protein